MTLLERVPRRPLTEVVLDQLLDRIASGVLAPGDALPPERQLCDELGVSRTAVREALARLAQLRLIQVRHGGETRVLDLRTRAGLDLLPRLLRRADGSPDLAVVRAGLEMRAALAPEVARLAALRGGAAAAAALDPVIAALAAAGDDVAARQRHSLDFWSIVVAGADNLAYQLAFNSLRDALAALRDAVAAAMTTELRDDRGYRAIADAIRRGEPDAAARAARAHLALGAAGLAGLAAARRRRRPA